MKTEAASCLLCGQSDAHRLLPRKVPSHVVCRKCGFVYQDPRPSIEEMGQYYEEGYWEDRQADGDVGNDAQLGWGPRALALSSWAESRLAPEDLVLEIGCGHGENLACLVDKLKCRGVGVEPSRMQAELARNRYGLEVLCADVQSVDLGGRRPKLIVLSHVLEHFRDPRAALRRCRELLTPDGLLWIEVPNILQPHSRKPLSSWLQPEHEYYFSPQSLRTVLNECGFRTVREENRTFVRVLAEVAEERSQAASNGPVRNEYLQVIMAIARHELVFWPTKIFRRLATIGRKDG